MRILVLVKQVCEPESLFDLVDGRVCLRVPVKYRMNSYDQYALEAALSLGEAAGGQVWALTVGPEGAGRVLERAAGMGAGECVHLCWDEEAPPRPSQVAHLVAAWARDRDFDLILAGAMSEDARQGAVGPMTARLLGLPLATSVVELEPEPGGGLRAVREMEGGRGQVVHLPLPALVTIQSGLNRPRYPSLSNLLRVKKNPPLTLPASCLPAGPVRERPAGAFPPARTREGLILEGSTGEKAAALKKILAARALL